jgi:flagellar protein FlaG
MVDPISNAPNPREIGPGQSRQQASPAAPALPNPQTQLTRAQRVEVLEAAVEKLIRRSLPTNSKLQIEHDEDTGTFIYRSVDPETGEVLRQWPSEQLLKLREHLSEMEGMLFDKEI